MGVVWALYGRWVNPEIAMWKGSGKQTTRLQETLETALLYIPPGHPTLLGDTKKEATERSCGWVNNSNGTTQSNGTRRSGPAEFIRSLLYSS